MQKTGHADYFLGSNTSNGFCSLFERSFNYADGWRVLLIKGGPGTGKSTLLRRICKRAEQAGVFYEAITCSSDTDSLDAVILPSLKRAIYDATAPHVLEPKYPGACEQIIDVSTTWDTRLLYERREDIIRYNKECSEHHARATEMLACADLFRRGIQKKSAAVLDNAKIDRSAVHVCDKYVKGCKSGTFGESLRLLTSVTPNGIMHPGDDNLASYGCVVPIHDRTYAVSERFMKALRARLLEKGCEIITCVCSQDHGRIEHIMVPGESVCFTVKNDAHSFAAENEARAVHADRFLPAGFMQKYKQLIVFNKKEMLSFTQLAADEMRRAKKVHDELENQYRDAVDFSAMNGISDKAADIRLG